MPRRRRIPCRMNLFSSSMAACLVSPVRWIYSFLVMQTFSCRNSISLFFPCFFCSFRFLRFLSRRMCPFQFHSLSDFLAECVADTQMHVLKTDRFGPDFLFLIIGILSAFQWSAEKSQLSEFYNVAVGKQVAQFVDASVQRRPIMFLARCWNIATCSTNSFWV